MVRATPLLKITACCCVAAVVCNAQAQEPRSNGASAKSGSLRERITNDLKKWDSITDHRTGSEGDNATAKWLAEEIRAVGLTPRLERCEFQRRVLQECSVIIGESRIVGVPLFDGGVTGREPIRAKLGRIGEAATIALTHYTTRKSDEATEAMMAARKRTEHVAIVAIGPENAIAFGMALLNAEAYGAPYGLPVLQVSNEHAESLDKALESGEEVGDLQLFPQKWPDRAKSARLWAAPSYKVRMYIYEAESGESRAESQNMPPVRSFVEMSAD
jgi:hypothetical protein